MKAALPLILGSIMMVSIFAGISAGDLVLHLSFDEGNGETTKDRVKGVNGNLTNNPKWVDGKFNKALEFDGKGRD